MFNNYIPTAKIFYDSITDKEMQEMCNKIKNDDDVYHLLSNFSINFKEYSTDGKVRHLSNEEDINIKLGKIIGPKFVEYRKKWDAVNKMEIVTDFPMFLQLDMNQKCNYKCP